MNRAEVLPTDALTPPLMTSSRGWRRLIYQATAGTLNPGPSPDEIHDRSLVCRIRTPLLSCHRIAVMSLQGGVGKSTTTVAVGSTLASLRGDRVVAIDPNFNRSMLGLQMSRTSALGVHELLVDAPGLLRYVDVSRYLSQAESRLEVLTSANDPDLAASFGAHEYRAVDDLLQRHYSILLTDCGPGLLRSAMRSVLDVADTLIIVSNATVEGRSNATAILDWLNVHGYAHLVREAIGVITMIPAPIDRVNADVLGGHFESRIRRVIRVPHDPRLASGREFLMSDLKHRTQLAYQEIAGAVAERFHVKGCHPVGWHHTASQLRAVM